MVGWEPSSRCRYHNNFKTLNLHSQIVIESVINYNFILLGLLLRFFVVVSNSNSDSRSSGSLLGAVICEIVVIFYVHRNADESRFVTGLGDLTVAALFKFVH